MLGVLTTTSPQHPWQEDHYRISRILISRLQADSARSYQGASRNEKRTLTGRQIAWMIYDFFNISGGKEAILDFTDLSNVPWKTTTFKPSTQRRTNYPRQLLTDLLTTESLHNFQVDSSEALKHVLQVYVQATTFGDKKYDYCRLMLLARRHLEQKIQESHFKARNRDEDRPAMGAPRRGKAKGKAKNMPNTTPREETAVVGSQEANVHVEKHAHSSMTRTRKAKGRDDLVHLLRQVLRTEIERWWKR